MMIAQTLKLHTNTHAWKLWGPTSPSKPHNKPRFPSTPILTVSHHHNSHQATDHCWHTTLKCTRFHSTAQLHHLAHTCITKNSTSPSSDQHTLSYQWAMSSPRGGPVVSTTVSMTRHNTHARNLCQHWTNPTPSTISSLATLNQPKNNTPSASNSIPFLPVVPPLPTSKCPNFIHPHLNKNLNLDWSSLPISYKAIQAGYPPRVTW